MKLLHGDCLEELKKLDADSIDAIVTDPPYGLSFMGKKWDHSVPSVEVWREALRVLKPGGHILVACGTRTQHRMVVNIEDAGFEIRDVITWLYGQGFPKSLDISKAIDKVAGAEREVVGEKSFADGSKARKTQKLGGNATFSDPISRESNLSVTAPSTDDAKKWQGFGTALKPACEFWTLARKPLSEKNVAANVLKWGTGGLNIDGSRIEAADQVVLDAAVKRMTGNSVRSGGATDNFISGSTTIQPKSAQGRFPANLVLDEEAGAALDEQSGITARKDLRTEGKSEGFGGGVNCYGESVKDFNKAARPQDHGGGASRFFYCAKVSSSERGEGNKHPTVKPIKLMRYLCKLVTPPNGIVLDPFMGSGSTGVAAIQEGFQFVGIEREAEYVEIAAKRLTHVKKA